MFTGQTTAFLQPFCFEMFSRFFLTSQGSQNNKTKTIEIHSKCENKIMKLKYFEKVFIYTQKKGQK
jgi:hypothetical protein